ncbi:hypothetical protein ACTIVE_8770 [Actinomadura verrucosospora]|uniref:Protein kinase domain-containing protein n=1 Tax=Actinomadura verrucosospora TaxID=46165 RepID=A0A7D3ZLF1_ACTVE|nr:hypothetical protein ACTIVE_8770 [Actinomadura verrucosospora]
MTGEDGQPNIIMELVPGRSLAGLPADHGPIPPQRAAALGLRILDALRTAHQAGIVHRDLKPANVLLDGERALLTDFGIAAVEGETVLTASGALLGTPTVHRCPQRCGRSASGRPGRSDSVPGPPGGRTRRRSGRPGGTGDEGSAPEHGEPQRSPWGKAGAWRFPSTKAGP